MPASSTAKWKSSPSTSAIVRRSSFEDVEAICTRNKSARAFALGDALGERDLPRLLRRLDEELWEVKLDPQKSEIGLLYGLISKVRAMILLKEMMREGWIKPEAITTGSRRSWNGCRRSNCPADKRFNPLAMNPYVLYKALPQVGRYTEDGADPRHGSPVAMQSAAGVEQP